MYLPNGFQVTFIFSFQNSISITNLSGRNWTDLTTATPRHNWTFRIPRTRSSSSTVATSGFGSSGRSIINALLTRTIRMRTNALAPSKYWTTNKKDLCRLWVSRNEILFSRYNKTVHVLRGFLFNVANKRKLFEYSSILNRRSGFIPKLLLNSQGRRDAHNRPDANVFGCKFAYRVETALPAIIIDRCQANRKDLCWFYTYLFFDSCRKCNF